MIDLILGPMGAVLGALLAALGAFFAGSVSANRKHKIRDLHGYKETREALDNVEADDDVDAARERLRRRGKS